VIKTQRIRLTKRDFRLQAKEMTRKATEQERERTPKPGQTMAGTEDTKKLDRIGMEQYQESPERPTEVQRRRSRREETVDREADTRSRENMRIVR
jgi:hypothetical protein